MALLAYTIEANYNFSPEAALTLILSRREEFVKEFRHCSGSLSALPLLPFGHIYDGLIRSSLVKLSAWNLGHV